MTTLVALLESTGVVWLASDQQLTGGDVIERQDFPKVRSLPDPQGGELAIGFAGDPCILALAARVMRKFDSSLDAPELAQALVCAVRLDCDAIGWCSKSAGAGEAPHRQASLVLAARGQLFELDIATEWAESIPAGQVRAWGSGRKLALGAADVMLETWVPEVALERAVRAAIRYDLYSGGDPVVVKVPRPAAAARREAPEPRRWQPIAGVSGRFVIWCDGAWHYQLMNGELRERDDSPTPCCCNLGAP